MGPCSSSPVPREPGKTDADQTRSATQAFFPSASTSTSRSRTPRAAAAKGRTRGAANYFRPAITTSRKWVERREFLEWLTFTPTGYGTSKNRSPQPVGQRWTSSRHRLSGARQIASDPVLDFAVFEHFSFSRRASSRSNGGWRSRSEHRAENALPAAEGADEIGAGKEFYHTSSSTMISNEATECLKSGDHRQETATKWKESLRREGSGGRIGSRGVALEMYEITDCGWYSEL